MRRPATTTRHSMNSRDRRRKRDLLLRRDGDCCRWCGEQFTVGQPPTLDHVVPRSKRGRDALWNLVLACRPCNERRADSGVLS